jgi:hypothetical protein
VLCSHYTKKITGLKKKIEKETINTFVYLNQVICVQKIIKSPIKYGEKYSPYLNGTARYSDYWIWCVATTQHRTTKVNKIILPINRSRLERHFHFLVWWFYSKLFKTVDQIRTIENWFMNFQLTQYFSVFISNWFIQVFLFLWRTYGQTHLFWTLKYSVLTRQHQEHIQRPKRESGCILNP